MVRSIYVRMYRWGIALLGGKGLHKIWPFGPIHDFLSDRARRYRTPESISVFGNTLYLLPGDNMGLSIWGEDYERASTKVVEAEVGLGDVFVDVGANLGFFTLLAAKLVGKQGVVYAFEPDGKNVEMLKKSIAANGYGNIVVEQKAASNEAGSIHFFLSEHNAGDHTMYDRQTNLRALEREGKTNPRAAYDQHSATDPRTKITVEAVTLNSYFKNKKVDFIKIDVQGGEANVAAGMNEVLMANPHVKLLTEFWPAGITLAGGNPAAYLESFSKLGFSFWVIERDGVHARTGAELLEEYTLYNNRTAELFIKRS